MESENTKKIMTVSFIAAAAVAWISSSVLLETLASTFGPVAQLRGQNLFKHGLPFLIAVVTFSCLQFNKKVTAYTDEVVTEIKKVVWPSRPETSAMTIVVCFMLILSGVVLGAFDLFSGYIVNYLIKI